MVGTCAPQCPRPHRSAVHDSQKRVVRACGSIPTKPDFLTHAHPGNPAVLGLVAGVAHVSSRVREWPAGSSDIVLRVFLPAAHSFF